MARALSGRGAHAHLGAHTVPLIGRISLDLTAIDVTDLPAEAARPGATVEILGARTPIDAAAGHAGTIGYEILTTLGARYARRYIGADNRDRGAALGVTGDRRMPVSCPARSASPP